MNESLITNWNNVVRPGDTVYCLGDFSMAFRPVEIITPRLMGDKILIPGNHDFCHSYNKKSRNVDNRHKWLQKYADNGWFVQHEHFQLNLPGVAVVNVCHMPYQGDLTDGGDKYHNYRMKDDGRILLCGHVHEKWKTKRTPQGTLMINVGVDQWGMTPVSLPQLVELINEQSLLAAETSKD